MSKSAGPIRTEGCVAPVLLWPPSIDAHLVGLRDDAALILLPALPLGLAEA